MAKADVTIYGAGIFGLTIAYTLLRRGANVRVIDPYGVAAGSSGGVVGALAPHTPENWNEKKAFQFDSLVMAETFWAEVETVSDHPSGYRKSGRLQAIVDDKARVLAEDRAVNAQTLWQGRASWQVRPATEFEGWAPQSPTGLVIHDTLSALLHPKMAVTALAAAVQALGGQIVETGAEEGKVVWATGHQGLLELSESLGKTIGNGVKGQAAVLAYDAGPVPQIFAETLHFIPHSNGTVAVGSTSERVFDDPKTTDAQIDALIARARAIMPVLADAQVLTRWAGVRPRAKSRAPLLGPIPGRPNHFIANGGFKIGFGMAPKIGQVMADLLLEGHDTIPEAFRFEALI